MPRCRRARKRWSKAKRDTEAELALIEEQLASVSIEEEELRVKLELTNKMNELTELELLKSRSASELLVQQIEIVDSRGHTRDAGSSSNTSHHCLVRSCGFFDFHRPLLPFGRSCQASAGPSLAGILILSFQFPGIHPCFASLMLKRGC